jgi:hypothetical protein
MTFFVSALLIAASAPGIAYEAVGEHRAWRLTVGDDGVRLAFAGASARNGGHVYPHVVAREFGSSRRWEAGAGVAVISVEARPGRCAVGGLIYVDKVRIRLSGRELYGCGGSRLSGARRR